MDRIATAHSVGGICLGFFQGILLFLLFASSPAWAQDAQPPPSVLSVSTASAPEGDGALVFVVSVNPPLDAEATVDYRTSDGSAKSTDFDRAAGTLTIPANTPQSHITVTVRDDRREEAHETLMLTLSNPSPNIVLGASGDNQGNTLTVNGIIEDDDIHVSVVSADIISTPSQQDCALGDDSAPQGRMRPCYAAGDVITVRVRFSRDIEVITNGGFAPRLHLKFEDGDRPAAYVGGSGTRELTFAYTVQPNDQDFNGIGIGLFPDSQPAGTGFEVNGAFITGAMLNSRSSYGASAPSAWDDWNVFEDTSSFRYLVAETDSFISVPSASTSSLLADQNDQLDTGDLDGHRVNGLGNHIRIDVRDAVASGSSIVFPVVLSDAVPASATAPLRVSYATQDNTASAGQHYVQTSGTLSFFAGQDVHAITVPLLSEAVSANTLDMLVMLGENPDAYAGATTVAPFDLRNHFDRSATGTIPPRSVLTVRNASMLESTGGVVFTVTASPVPYAELTVQYETTHGTTNGEDDSDFVAGTGTFTIAAGQAEGLLTIVVNDDEHVEPDETFTLTLRNPSAHATFGRVSSIAATGTIRDDDSFPIVRFTSDPEPVLESVGEIVFTVEISEHVSANVGFGRVQFTLYPGTALDADAGPAGDNEPQDYNPGNNARTLTFIRGQSLTQEVTVPIIDDTIDEAEERFTAVLSSGNGFLLDGRVAIGRILDDDEPPVMRIVGGHAKVGEGDGEVVFTVQASGPSSRPVTVAYQTMDGTAVAEEYPGHTEDYHAASGTITMAAYSGAMESGSVTSGPFEAGEMPSFPVTVRINDDDWIDTGNRNALIQGAAQDSIVYVGDEQFTFALRELSDPLAVTVVHATTEELSNANVADGVRTVTIVDDDAKPRRPRLEVGDFTARSISLWVPEGQSVSYELVLATGPRDRSDVLALDVVIPEQAPLSDEPGGALLFAHSPENRWNRAREITISATEDDNATHETITVAHVVHPSSSVSADGADSWRHGAVLANVVVHVTDNDTPPMPDVQITPSSLVATEGQVIEFTAALTARPGAESGGECVALDITPPEGSTATWANAQDGLLTICEADSAPPLADMPGWAVPRTVTVSVGHDNNTHPETTAITLGVNGDRSDAANYLNRTFSVPLIVLDDDRAPRIQHTYFATWKRFPYDAFTYTVVLGGRPTSDVTVRVTSQDGGVARVGSGTVLDLVFSPSGANRWDLPQTVTVNNGDRAVVGDVIRIDHVAISDDPNYDGFSGRSIEATLRHLTLSIFDNSATESEGAIVFQVLPSIRVDEDLMVGFETSSGSTTAGADYVETSGMLTLQTDHLGAAITVPIVDDDYEEPGETFTVTLRDAGPTSVLRLGGRSVATGIIENDDHLPDPTDILLSVTPEDALEPADDVSANAVTEVVMRVAYPPGSGRLNRAVEVSVTFAGDTATESDDFMAVPGFVLTIPAWEAEATATIPLTVLHDDLDEVAETIAVSGMASGFLVQGATVSLVDNDAPVLGIRAPEPVMEGATEMVFEVMPSHVAEGQVTVEYRTSSGGGESGGDGTGAAEPGADYIAQSGTLTIGAVAGENENRITIALGADDDLYEGAREAFTVTLFNPSSGAVLGDEAAAVGIIEENDAAPTNFTLAAAPAVVDEAAGSIELVLTLTVDDDTAFEDERVVQVAVTPAGAGNAWEVAFPLTIAAGAREGTVRYTLIAADGALFGRVDMLAIEAAMDETVLDAITIAIDKTDVGLVFTDAAGETMEAPVSLAATEGGTVTYGVQMRALPFAETTVTVTSDAPQKAAASPATLRFTTDNWQAVQMITVTAANDEDGASETIMLMHAVTSTEDDFDVPPAALATLVVADDDAPGLVIAPNALCIIEPDALGAAAAGDAGDTEDAGDGATEDAPAASAARLPPEGCPAPIGVDATYTVALKTAPLADVTVAPGLNRFSWLGASVEQLTFTPGNWRSPQTITLHASQGDDDAHTDTETLFHAITSTDALYAIDKAGPVRVTLVDDDVPGLVVDPTSLTVTEGQTATYALQLSTEPRTHVTVSFADGEKVSFRPEALTFTGLDWDEPQTVTLRALADDDATDDTVIVAHVTGSFDSDYEGLSETLLATIVDSDIPRLKSVAMHDRAAPAVGDTYGFGEQIGIAATFSRSVRVQGAPQLRFGMGSKVRLATYIPRAEEYDLFGATGEDVGELLEAAARKLTFVYTVQADDNTDGGLEIRANPLVIDEARGDAIVDAQNPEVAAHEAIAEGEFEVSKESMAMVRVQGNRDFLLASNAGEDIEAKEGAQVTLVGAATTSGDPDDLIYRWTQRTVGGDADERCEERDVELQAVLDSGDGDAAPYSGGGTATFATPNDLTFDTVLTFVLEVENPHTDDEPKRDEMEVTIIATNDPPVAHAGEHQTAQEGEAVTLDGSQSQDPEGKRLAFSWAQKQGNEPRVELASADQSRATFVAPDNLYDDTRLEFVLTVTDIGGLQGTAEVAVTVNGKGLTRVLGHALSRFGRSAASSTVDAVTERLNAPSRAASGRIAANMELGGSQWDMSQMFPASTATGVGAPGAGHSLPGDPIENHQAAIHATDGSPHAAHFADRLRSAGRPVTFGRDSLMRGNFRIGLAAAPQDNLNASDTELANWTLWGRAEHRAFGANPVQDLTLDGTVDVVHIGFDRGWGQGRGLVGMTLSQSAGNVRFVDGEVAGDAKMGLMMVLPYARWSPTDNIDLWGMIGGGTGDASIKTDAADQAAETSIGARMIAGGGRSDLAEWFSIEWSTKADAFTMQLDADETDQLDAIGTDVGRLRLGLEGRDTWNLSQNDRLRPSLAANARLDSGDAEQGFGIEVEAAFAYEHDQGIFIEGRARQLTAHASEAFKEWGASLMVRITPGSAGGFGMSLSPVWGETTSQSQALWQGDQLLLQGMGNTFHPTTTTTGHPRQLQAELFYDLDRAGWLLTPYGALDLQNNTQGERLGLRLAAQKLRHGSLHLDLFGERTPNSEVGTSFKPGLQGTLQLLLH